MSVTETVANAVADCLDEWHTKLAQDGCGGDGNRPPNTTALLHELTQRAHKMLVSAALPVRVSDEGAFLDPQHARVLSEV